MEGPTYVTLSAQMALQQQLDVVANNVANANTTGYKADRQLFQTYLELLKVPGREVAFVQDRATYLDRSAGPLQPTDNPFDVAIQGEGFLAVQTRQGRAYTRDRRLKVSSDGALVNQAGQPVLSGTGDPIQLPERSRDFRVRSDGTVTVRVDGTAQEIGQIGMFRAADPTALRKTGSGQITDPTGRMIPVASDDMKTRLIQGTLEGSTVQPVKELTNMTELSRAYERLQRLVTDDNERERKMIDTLGHPN